MARGRPKKGVSKGDPEPGDYIVSSKNLGIPQLSCELCGEVFPMQSNLAIAEELLRISRYLDPPPGPACRNELCTFNGIPQESAPGNYVRFGTNAHGTPRYRCKACLKVVSHGGKSTRRQRITHLNRDIFEHLVNSVPLRRTIKLLKITPGVLYNRLNFISTQCLSFAGERERGLLDRRDLGTRYVSVDRQALMVNWSDRKDRRNTLFLSVASADTETGYVFGVHLNYDPDLDPAVVYQDLPKFGDHWLRQPFRRYARLWLPQDFDHALERNEERTTARNKRTVLSEAIDATYAEALDREDIEAGTDTGVEFKSPSRGMQIHSQITMNAHIQFVARLLGRADKIRLFMDQESGLRAAFMAAFKERLKARTADAFYVRVLKDTTVDVKRNRVRQALKRLSDAQAAHPKLSKPEVERLLMKQEIVQAEKFGKWDDKWVKHPVPDMREPEKQMCWLTDQGDYDEDHIANLYLKATLAPVDRFFMQVRRGVTMAERGIVSASAAGRAWFGKNAYDPGNLAKLLEIFRVYFNFCEVGEDGKTPAMRLGLARGPIASEDILYFVRKSGEPSCAEDEPATRVA